MEYIERISFGAKFKNSPVSLIAQCLEKWFRREQQVTVVSLNELCFSIGTRIPVRSATPCCQETVPITKKFAINCTANKDVLPWRGFEELSSHAGVPVARVSIDDIEVYNGSIVDSVEFLYKKIQENAVDAPRSPAPQLRSLEQLARDLSLHIEMRETASALSQIIDCTQECVHFTCDLNAYEYTFAFRNPRVYNYQGKAITRNYEFVVERQRNGSFCFAFFHAPQFELVYFYNEFYRTAEDLVVNLSRQFNDEVKINFVHL